MWRWTGWCWSCLPAQLSLLITDSDHEPEEQKGWGHGGEHKGWGLPTSCLPPSLLQLTKDDAESRTRFLGFENKEISFALKKF